MKFKKGQLVELIKTKNNENLGHRFIVTGSKRSNWSDDKLNGILGYKTDIPAKNNVHGFMYAPEPWLKIVKPDGDELSEFTFNELISNLSIDTLITK